MRDSSEIQILARLLRPRSSAEDVVPCSDAQWNRAASTAHDNGLCGLLLERVGERHLPFPESLALGLMSGARCVASRNKSLDRELETVLGVLQEANVPTLLLKGAALACTVYDRPDLRPMSDVDLLVHPRDARRAVAALLSGVCRSGTELVRGDFFPRFHYELELWTRSATPARIDLHARPFRPLRYARIIPDAAMWHDAIPISIGAARAFVPSAERMFIHLAAHAAFHGCSRLIWLYDLVRWCDRRSDAMNWSRVIECCRDWKLCAAVGHAMRRTAELFGPAWPDGVERELARTSPGWRDRWVLRQAPHDAASPLRHVICNLLTTPGLRFKLGYLRAVALPDGAHLEALYAGRHVGWRMMAIGRRIANVILRALRLPVLAGSVGVRA